MSVRTFQEASLESAFQKIARIIARRYGVTVAIRGNEAYVDLDKMEIVLPSLGQTQGLQLEHMDGFLDHECSHVLFTQPKIFDKVKDQPTLKGLWNGCEDVWIEREMGRKYYGCHENLEQLNGWLYAQCEERWSGLDALGRLTYALERCYRGDQEKEAFTGDPLIGGLIRRLEPEIARGRVCATSQEAFAIAESILAKIKQLANGEDFDGFVPGSFDEFGSSYDCGFRGQRREVSLARGAVASASETEPQRAERKGKEASDLETASPRDIREHKEQQEELKAAQSQAESFLEQDLAGSFAQPLDVESLVNEGLHAAAVKLRRSSRPEPPEYVVFSEAYDVDTTYSAEERARWGSEYRDLREQVRSHIGNLANILEMTLRAEAADRWVGGARQGRKFDQRRLAYWAEGSDDDRVFRYREQGLRHDTAVSLLWDCSGSMQSASNSRSKAALARIAAIAFHEALKRCPFIQHEVLGFNSDQSRSPDLANEVEAALAGGDNLWRYSRLADRDSRKVFVPFGSEDGRALTEITGSGSNRDGECVLWAAKRLARRPESRKILIVGSDGQPQGARYSGIEKKYLREVVCRIMQSGLEVYGLGIMDSSVLKYYQHAQVIHDVRNLPRAVLTLLASSLSARKGHMDAGRLGGFARV